MFKYVISFNSHNNPQLLALQGKSKVLQKVKELTTGHTQPA